MHSLATPYDIQRLFSHCSITLWENHLSCIILGSPWFLSLWNLGLLLWVLVLMWDLILLLRDLLLLSRDHPVLQFTSSSPSTDLNPSSLGQGVFSEVLPRNLSVLLAIMSTE